MAAVVTQIAAGLAAEVLTTVVISVAPPMAMVESAAATAVAAAETAIAQVKVPAWFGLDLGQLRPNMGRWPAPIGPRPGRLTVSESVGPRLADDDAAELYHWSPAAVRRVAGKWAQVTTQVWGRTSRQSSSMAMLHHDVPAGDDGGSTEELVV